MSELVSIITPSYNSAQYINSTIESILAQTYEEWEMIIIDDLSTDESIKIISNYTVKDSRIKLIKLDKNSGAAIARNTGIEKAKGNYIAFLDSDDLWHPQKLEKQICFMQKNNYSFCYTYYEQIDENGNKLNKRIKSKSKATYDLLLKNNFIGCLTAIYSCKDLGKIYMPIIRKRQDYALWLKILKKGITGFCLDEYLAYYRVRKDSISSNKLNLIKYQWKLYRDIENLSLLLSIKCISSIILKKILRR